MHLKKTKMTLVCMPNGQHLPVENAFNIALSLHQAGKINRAAEIYRCILKKQPKHADTLHLCGVARSQQGKFDESIKLLRSAIKTNANVPLYYSNLGEAYRKAGKLDKAAVACKQALKLNPTLPEVHLNLGAIALVQASYDAAIVSYQKALSYREGYVDAILGIGDSLVKQGQVEKGLARFEEILVYQPDSLAALTRIGITLRMLNRIDDAIAHYEKAISQLPDEADLYNNLALLYQRTANNKAAAKCLRKLLALTPDDATAKHMLSALDGATTETAPAEYVRDVFDGYAETFETHLVNTLGYHTPELLTRVILDSIGHNTDLAVLDLGCGTGLMAVALQDYCSHLAGVDLAPKMIEQARAKNIYHELAVGDVVDFMQSKDAAAYNIIVAADVFVYIGKLNSIFAEAKRLLSVDGIFAFSVEAIDDETVDFVLNETGRYGHSKKYLQALQQEHGFIEKCFTKAHIRNQGDKPVYGYLCVYGMS